MTQFGPYVEAGNAKREHGGEGGEAKIVTVRFSGSVRVATGETDARVAEEEAAKIAALYLAAQVGLPVPLPWRVGKDGLVTLPAGLAELLGPAVEAEGPDESESVDDPPEWMEK